MKTLTETRFILDHPHSIGQEVDVYLQNREVIGKAKVISVLPTSCQELDGSIKAKFDVRFEFNESLKSQDGEWSPYYSGSDSHLCLYDVRAKREREVKEKFEAKRRLQRTHLDYRYGCLKCGTVLATNRELKYKQCKNCRKSEIQRI